MAVYLQDNRHNSVITQSFGVLGGGLANRTNIKRISMTGTVSRHYSVSAFYSLATEQDNEIEDELAQGKNKNKIKFLLCKFNNSFCSSKNIT